MVFAVQLESVILSIAKNLTVVSACLPKQESAPARSFTAFRMTSLGQALLRFRCTYLRCLSLFLSAHHIV